jgi:hypothetical protein
LLVALFLSIQIRGLGIVQPRKYKADEQTSSNVVAYVGERPLTDGIEESQSVRTGESIEDSEREGCEIGNNVVETEEHEHKDGREHDGYLCSRLLDEDERHYGYVYEHIGKNCFPENRRTGLAELAFHYLHNHTVVGKSLKRRCLIEHPSCNQRTNEIEEGAGGKNVDGLLYAQSLLYWNICFHLYHLLICLQR